MQVMKSTAIARFLAAKTHKDLATLYNLNMECQVNVGQDGGTRIDSEFKGRSWQAWTDGTNTWKSFRIPYKAATEPEYVDTPMNYSLEDHAEAIGMTGWDWVNKKSLWVAFDFDAISGHSEKHAQRLTAEELQHIQDIACQVPWITVRRSTGGKGLHLYVFLDGVPTDNHTEHAAVARAILGKLSALTGHDFNGKVDTCGGNMWVWRRTMNPEEGLKLVKQGEVLHDIPPNWRDHVGVISGKQRKARMSKGSSEPMTEAERMFEEITGQRQKTPLDDSHKAIIKYLLEDNQTGSWWDADRHMLVSHTWWLQKAHEDLNLKGIFTTKTEQPMDHNVFMYPLRQGAWTVRRYTPGVQETPAWTQDAHGYTQIYYNHAPDLNTAARAHGGEEKPKGGYIFKELEVALQAASKLGAIVEIPKATMSKRETTLRAHKDGRLIIEFEKKPTDSIESGWIPIKDLWTKVVSVNTKQAAEAEVGNYDDLVRHIVTQTGEDYGWVIKSTGEKWVTEPLIHIKAALGSQGLDSKEATLLVGQSVMRAWTLVNKPFQDEYPGDREWNREAAQFRYTPSLAKEDLVYPTWMKVLNHIGDSLNKAIEADGWCRANGIITGADYLKTWLSSMVKEPLEPLPYLFLYGPQDSGKSILHEALTELFTKGVARADIALTDKAGYNAQLEGAILCAVEEINLRHSKDANNRIKDWVTARQLPIHRKYQTPYSIPNTTHWIQTSNEIDACPVFPGDTRVTMVYVGSLDPIELIPKKELLGILIKEAPDFLASLLTLELPPATGRLNVPVITTEDKRQIQQSNETSLETFLREHCYLVTGKMIKYGDLYDKFKDTLEPAEVDDWSKRTFGKQLPRHFPKGRHPKDTQVYIGNISYEPRKPDEPILPPLVIKMRSGEEFLGIEGS